MDKARSLFNLFFGTALLLSCVVMVVNLFQGKAAFGVVWLIHSVLHLETDLFGVIDKMLTASLILIALYIAIRVIFYNPVDIKESAQIE